MSFKKTILQKYINQQPINHIFDHDHFYYLWDMIKTVFFLGVLYILFFIGKPFIQSVRFDIGVAGIGTIIYIQYIIWFLNSYLDSLIITPNGIIMFRRDGLLEYKNEYFEWSKIEVVSHEQKNFIDTLLHTGDLVITLDHGLIFEFERIHNPVKKASILLNAKADALRPPEESPDQTNQDKFTMLVETLWEVIIDYMKSHKDITK